MIPSFPYRLSESTARVLGLIVLQVDETIEHEFRHYLGPEDARLHVSRVPSGDDLTPDTIATLETELTAAAALLPPAARFDVVGFACTSATARIGADRVRALVAAGTGTRHVTNPLTAALAAFHHHGLKRVGIVSPYVPSVAASLRESFVTQGVAVPDMLSFGEQVEARVARIDPHSIAEAARALAGRQTMDAVFLSCTNLRTFGLLENLKAELGLPVLSSNQVLAWHMTRLAGASSERCGLGG